MCHTKGTDPFGPRHWFGPPGGPSLFHGMKHRWRTFMPYSLVESDKEFIVTMPLPGFDIKDLEVSVKETFLYIEAKKPEAEDNAGTKPYKIRSLGEFLWNRPHVAVKVRIGEKIRPETVKAKLAKGILTITIEKVPGTKVDVEEEI